VASTARADAGGSAATLRDTLVAPVHVPRGAAAPGTVTVQVHFSGRGATDAFWRIVARQAAVDTVREFPDFITATWGDVEDTVGFSLYARDDSRALETHVVVTTDGGELP
jgi:hypothetical protein